MPEWLNSIGRINTINIYIDEETCTCCELCYDAIPAVFSDRGDGIPIVLKWNIKDDLLGEIYQVCGDCPSGSIILDIG